MPTFVCLCPPLSMLYSILKAAWRIKYGLWRKITSISSILYGWCTQFVYYWEDTPLGLFHLAVQRSFSESRYLGPELKLESRKSVVGIVTCCGLQDWGWKSGGGRRFSLLHSSSDEPSCPPSLYNEYRVPLPRTKWPERCFDRRPPLFSTEVKNE
jgi:hypothetical protein